MAIAARTTTCDQHGDIGLPGGKGPAERPVDLVHLARQTLGDPDLEREILALFLTQIKAMAARLPDADASERMFLVHGLKGTARSVGAFPLARTAAGYEDVPGDASLAVMMDGLAATSEYVERLLG
jgi:HPt (histidine-containing phosphotransfer) domain-containing protein